MRAGSRGRAGREGKRVGGQERKREREGGREKESEDERVRQRTKRVTVTSRCMGSLCSTHFREHSFARLSLFFLVGFLFRVRDLSMGAWKQFCSRAIFLHFSLPKLVKRSLRARLLGSMISCPRTIENETTDLPPVETLSRWISEVTSLKITFGLSKSAAPGFSRET